MPGVVRARSFGQSGPLTCVDRLGIWLSRRRVLAAFGDRSAPLDILDLGCGYEASLLRSLRGTIGRGVGVDVRVRGAGGQNEGLWLIESEIERAFDLLGDATFDAVLLVSVLEHLADPLETLGRSRLRLRAGGVLLVNVPTWRGKWFLELSAFRLGFSPREEMDDHKMYYDKRDLWPLLVKAGFAPSAIKLRYYKGGLNLFATVRR